MSEAKRTDWERIESDFRAGLLSVREIAATHGISHTAINKRAKVEGWERDLSAKIKAKADALVSKREVSAEVSTQRLESDRAIIEANAEVTASAAMRISIATGYDPVATKAQVRTAVLAYMSSLTLGQSLAYTRLLQVAYDASPGVTNITGLTINGNTADNSLSGVGGNSYLGATNGTPQGTGSRAAVGPGSGGSGGNNPNFATPAAQAGAAGNAGTIIIYEYA